MRVIVCDADSGGITGPVILPDGCTVGDFFESKKGHADPSKYRITMNERPATTGSTLYDGCRLNISPAKLAGAQDQGGVRLGMGKRRKSTAQMARKQGLDALFVLAVDQAQQVGCQPVYNAIHGLAVLDEPLADQVKQAIGLVDGFLDLHKRYGNLVKAERVEVAAETDADTPEEVSDTKARQFPGHDYEARMTRIRVFLAMVYAQITAPDQPVSPKDQVPVPAAGVTTTEGRDRVERGGQR